MVSFDFHDSLAYPLFRNNNIMIRGYFECEHDIFFHSASDYSKDINDFFVLDNIKKFRNINGNFFVLSETERYVIVLTDRINSFPIYYYEEKIGFCISDRLPKNRIVSQEKLNEFLSCGFVVGKRTVYENVFQLQAGQVLVYDKIEKSYYCEDYFKHIHTPDNSKTDKEWIEELDCVVDKTINNMIKRLRGRHVALFLSGGYDSKLIASELKKRGYENITCIILGSEKTKDVKVAKEIAKTLNYRYLHILVNKNYWRKKLESGYMYEYFQKCSSFSSMPYLQGIVLKDLIEEQVIPADSVAVTGNSGDVVEGNDVTHCFYRGIKYSFDDIKKWIVERHFMLNGKKEAKKLSKYFNISNYIISEKLLAENRCVSAEEAEDIIEYFNWRERQSKYVVQDVRNYDYILGNVEWLLPLWHNVFVDFWLTVPYEYRYDRKLYYNYLGKESLPTANSITFKRKILNSIKKISGNLLNPLYILKAKYDYKYNDDFYFAPYGLLEKQQFREILKKTKGYREPHSENIARMTARYY